MLLPDLLRPRHFADRFVQGVHRDICPVQPPRAVEERGDARLLHHATGILRDEPPRPGGLNRAVQSRLLPPPDLQLDLRRRGERASARQLGGGLPAVRGRHRVQRAHALVRALLRPREPPRRHRRGRGAAPGSDGVRSAGDGLPPPQYPPLCPGDGRRRHDAGRDDPCRLHLRRWSPPSAGWEADRPVHRPPPPTEAHPTSSGRSGTS